MDRVLASEAKGRGFDPRQPHQSLDVDVEIVQNLTYLINTISIIKHKIDVFVELSLALSLPSQSLTVLYFRSSARR